MFKIDSSRNQPLIHQIILYCENVVYVGIDVDDVLGLNKILFVLVLMMI